MDLMKNNLNYYYYQMDNNLNYYYHFHYHVKMILNMMDY